MNDVLSATLALFVCGSFGFLYLFYIVVHIVVMFQIRERNRASHPFFALTMMIPIIFTYMMYQVVMNASDSLRNEYSSRRWKRYNELSFFTGMAWASFINLIFLWLIVMRILGYADSNKTEDNKMMMFPAAILAGLASIGLIINIFEFIYIMIRMMTSKGKKSKKPKTQIKKKKASKYEDSDLEEEPKPKKKARNFEVIDDDEDDEPRPRRKPKSRYDD